MKAVVAAFNQEKALVGAFSVITNLRMELFEALAGSRHQPLCWRPGRATVLYRAAAGVLSRPVTAVSTPVASARGWGPRTQARHHTDVSNDKQENVSNS